MKGLSKGIICIELALLRDIVLVVLVAYGIDSETDINDTHFPSAFSRKIVQENYQRTIQRRMMKKGGGEREKSVLSVFLVCFWLLYLSFRTPVRRNEPWSVKSGLEKRRATSQHGLKLSVVLAGSLFLHLCFCFLLFYFLLSDRNCCLRIIY